MTRFENRLWFGLLGLLIVLSAGDSYAQAARGSGQAAPANGVLQSQESNIAGVLAEMTECRREDGVLSIKMRLRNTGAKATDVVVLSSGGPKYDSYYVMAGTKKYMILRDSEKSALASPPDFMTELRVNIAPGGSWTWWAKYPAPPAADTKINYMTPLAPPFDNVPIAK
jgi:hypothetical protein